MEAQVDNFYNFSGQLSVLMWRFRCLLLPHCAPIEYVGGGCVGTHARIQKVLSEGVQL